MTEQKKAPIDYEKMAGVIASECERNPRFRQLLLSDPKMTGLIVAEYKGNKEFCQRLLNAPEFRQTMNTLLAERKTSHGANAVARINQSGGNFPQATPTPIANPALNPKQVINEVANAAGRTRGQYGKNIIERYSNSKPNQPDRSIILTNPETFPIERFWYDRDRAHLTPQADIYLTAMKERLDTVVKELADKTSIDAMRDGNVKLHFPSPKEFIEKCVSCGVLPIVSVDNKLKQINGFAYTLIKTPDLDPSLNPVVFPTIKGGMLGHMLGQTLSQIARNAYENLEIYKNRYSPDRTEWGSFKDNPPLSAFLNSFIEQADRLLLARWGKYQHNIEDEAIRYDFKVDIPAHLKTQSTPTILSDNTPF